MPTSYTYRALLLAALLLLSGCAYYSFTGASIPSHLNTVAIPLVEDNSISTVTGLDDRMTELLMQRFVNQTSLQLESNEPDADAVLTARIERYQNAPTAVSGDEVAERNRVTISVAVVYTDQVNDEVLLERSFSGFAEYDPLGSEDEEDEDGLANERDAAERALENIADDIFTAATSNW